jgi:protein TonB
MYSVSDPSSPRSDRAAGRRSASLILTICAHILLLLMLLRLAQPVTKMTKNGGNLVTFTVAPDSQEQAASSRSQTRKQSRTAPSTEAARPTPPPPPIQLPSKAEPWVLTPGLERFDIRQVAPAHDANPPSDASTSDEANGDSTSDRSTGYGPAGQPLYEARWYREPTDAELSYYTKLARPGAGYGEIACQTVARLHVDNCTELEETPGSGYARAVREAAWQFLVLPPRVGGKTMVGSWVRIRITFEERKAR